MTGWEGEAACGQCDEEGGHGQRGDSGRQQRGPSRREEHPAKRPTGRNRQVPSRCHHRLRQINAITGCVRRRRLHHRPGTTEAKTSDNGCCIDGKAQAADERQENSDGGKRSDREQYQHAQHPID